MLSITELLIPLIGYSVPLVISPGPGNALLAASGARFGLRQSIPFWIGFEIANIALCVVYGLGLGTILEQYPMLYTTMKWAGISYIVYLGYRFLKPSALKKKMDVKPLHFINGFISVITNPKINAMILVMFTQFIDTNLSLVPQIIKITSIFFVVGILCHLLWLLAGQTIFNRFNSAHSLKIQAYVFAGSLFLVAGYMALWY